MNQQWQALAQLLRGSKRLGQSKLRAFFARKLNRPKPSLVDAIGKRRKANTLEEYRRRFASTAGQGTGLAGPASVPAPAATQGFNEPPQPGREPFKWPEPAGSAEPQHPALEPPERSATAESPRAAPEPSKLPVRFSRAEPPRPLLEPSRPPEHVTIAEPPRKAPEPPKPQGRSRKPQRTRRPNAHHRFQPADVDWSGRLVQGLNEAWSLVPPEVRQRRNELIAAIAACIVVFGGAYGYRAMKEGNTAGNQPVRATQAAQPPVQLAAAPTVEQRQKKPAASAKKTYYDRLPAEEPQAAPEGPPASAAPAISKLAGSASVAPEGERPAVAPPTAANAEPARSASAAPAVERPVIAPAPVPAPPAIAAQLHADGRTVVRAERYLPDGTRIDNVQPAAIPAIAASVIDVPRAPVPASAEPKSAAPEAAVAKQPESTPAAPAAAAAEPAPPLTSGYFAQVKSDQNQKSAEAELAAIAEKAKGVLGEVPLITRQADLKDRGIWFRVLAGPVKSHDDADNLCRRLKTAGIQACIVQKLD